MAQMGLLWCPRQAASTDSGGRGSQGAAVAAVGRHREQAGCSGIGRLMRKLRKQSKVLCSATRPTTFRCQYDPLSYALNFDGDGFGDDASHFAFSSRFVSGTSFKCPTTDSAAVVAPIAWQHQPACN